MKDGEWASTLGITFVDFVHKVNIISISNLVGKCLIFDTYEHLRIYNAELNITHPTVYIYSHYFGKPYEPTPKRVTTKYCCVCGSSSNLFLSKLTNCK